MNFKAFFTTGVVAASIALSGCSTIEKRDDTVPKKKLSQITSKVNFKNKWKISSSSGAGKDASNLVLGESKDVIYTAGVKGKIVATNKKTGNLVWSSKINKEIIAGPSVSDKFVLVVSKEGGIHAFKAKDGSIAWTKELNTEVLAAPAIDNKLALIHSLDGNITALNVNDGKQLWQFNYVLPSIVLRKSSTPVIRKDSIVCGLANGKIVSLFKDTGEINWIVDLSEFNTGNSALSRMSDISSDPVVQNGMVYVVNYQGRLVAISERTGEIAWDKDASSYSGLAVKGDRVYLADDRGHISSFNAETGILAWDSDTLEGRELTTPSIYKNTLVLGDDDGMVHFLNLKTGKTIARYKLDTRGINTKPLFKNNDMFVLGTDGTLANINIENL